MLQTNSKQAQLNLVNSLQEAINVAIDIAKNGTEQDKVKFVNWACTAISWFSAQFDKESQQALRAVNAQYKAYLNALTK